MRAFTENELRRVWNLGVWKRRKDVDLHLGVLEERGCPLPLAVRRWMADIGEVSLAGRHPLLSPWYTDVEHEQVYSDPLMVAPSLEFLRMDMESGAEEGALFVSLSGEQKAEIALDYHADFNYCVKYPEACADGTMSGLWYEATFVQYVRKNFEWGGFPGWERYENRPLEIIEFLRAGLLPV